MTHFLHWIILRTFCKILYKTLNTIFAHLIQSWSQSTIQLTLCSNWVWTSAPLVEIITCWRLTFVGDSIHFPIPVGYDTRKMLLMGYFTYDKKVARNIIDQQNNVLYFIFFLHLLAIKERVQIVLALVKERRQIFCYISDYILLTASFALAVLRIQKLFILGL